MDLEREVITIDELGRQQEYTPYITLKSNVAYSILLVEELDLELGFKVQVSYLNIRSNRLHTRLKC